MLSESCRIAMTEIEVALEREGLVSRETLRCLFIRRDLGHEPPSPSFGSLSAAHSDSLPGQSGRDPRQSRCLGPTWFCLPM